MSDNITYLTARSQMSLLQQLDVVANNSANINFTKHREDRAVFSRFLYKDKDDTISVLINYATVINTQDGVVRVISNPLSLAIQGWVSHT